MIYALCFATRLHSKRKDSGTHKVVSDEVKKLIEGLALQKPAGYLAQK